jgi:hypothetical protein
MEKSQKEMVNPEDSDDASSDINYSVDEKIFIELENEPKYLYTLYNSWEKIIKYCNDNNLHLCENLSFTNITDFAESIK